MGSVIFDDIIWLLVGLFYIFKSPICIVSIAIRGIDKAEVLRNSIRKFTVTHANEAPKTEIRITDAFPHAKTSPVLMQDLKNSAAECNGSMNNLRA